MNTVTDVNPITQMIAVSVDMAYASLQAIAQGSEPEAKKTALDTISKIHKLYVQGLDMMELSGVDVSQLREIFESKTRQEKE